MKNYNKELTEMSADMIINDNAASSEHDEHDNDYNDGRHTAQELGLAVIEHNRARLALAKSRSSLELARAFKSKIDKIVDRGRE